MDSLSSVSSASGNINKGRNLLGAVFAIATSVSGSVNATTAQIPKFTDEPAGSPKIVNLTSAQQSILDMLTADHKSRPKIVAAIKALEDGGSSQELSNLFTWAKAIVESSVAPPAAKEKANEILNILQPDLEQVKTEPRQDNNTRGKEPIAVADVNNGPEKKAILPPIGQAKPKSIPLDLKGLDEGNNGWNVKGISKKGKITIEKMKETSETRIVIEPREISDNYISITKGLDRQTQRGSSEVTIGCDFTIENLPGANLYLQYAQVDPATKQWTGYQTVDFTENGKAFVKISGSGPIRFGLGVKGIPTNADGSIKELPDAKIIITGLEIKETKDTK